MGCSSSIQPSAVSQPQPSRSITIPKQNQVVEPKSLIEACRSGDIERVMVLLKTIAFAEINKTDSNIGDTPLHLATYHGHIDIVRLLLNHGAIRNILNYKNKIPEKKLFERSTNDNLIRFVGDDSNEEEDEEIEYELSYIGQWDINQTVETLRKEPELENIPGLDVVWDLLEQARAKNDAKYLSQAYIVESKFYKILNKKLAQRRLKKSTVDDENHQMQTLMQNTMAMFNQGFAMVQALMAGKLQTDNSKITDWIHRYIGTIHSLIYQPMFQFNGLIYRGMWIKEENLFRYSENQLHMCNKTL